MLELRVLDTVIGDPSLVGPYSRFGWNHPGPMLFWVLAVPYLLSDGSSWMLLVGAAGLNVASVVVTVWLAWRRGGPLLGALVAIALVAVQLSMGEVLLRDPWNPWITVLPTALAVVAAWASLEGDRAGPVLVVVVGSFLAQSHVGFGPVVAVLVVVTVAGWWWRRLDRRPLVAAAVAGIVCWIPVVVDSLIGQGNARSLVGHFVASGTDGDPVGLPTSVGIAARQLAPIGPWAGGAEPTGQGGGMVPGALWLLVLPLVAVVLSAVLAGQRGLASALRLQLVVVAASIAGVLAVSRIDGAAYDYLLRWWWPLAGLWWTAVAWPVVTAITGRARHTLRRDVFLGALAAVGVMAIIVGRPAHPHSHPIGEWTPVVRAVAVPLIDELWAEGITAVCVRREGPLSGWVKDGVTLQLAKAGIDVVVPDIAINPNKFGEHRLPGPRPVQADLAIVTTERGSSVRTSGEEVIVVHEGNGDLPDTSVILDRQVSGSCERTPSDGRR